jgi:phospholipase A1
MKLRKFALVLIAYPALTQTQNAMAETALMERRALENKWSDSGVTMFPHRPTYFLPFAYNTNPNDAPYQAVGEPPLDNTEVKFQISFKVPLARSLFSDNTQLYFAYTQLCLWQLYNKEISSPFRDTNYEPEFFCQCEHAPLRRALD